MRVFLIALSVILTAGVSAKSGYCQSLSPAACQPQYLERLFNVSEVLPCVTSVMRRSGGRDELFTPQTASELQGLRASAAADFERWNYNLGLVVEAIRPSLYQVKKGGKTPEGYNRYKDAIIAKLALYRKYNLLGTVQILGAPPQHVTESHLKTLFAIYEMKDSSCADQTPGGICMCDLNKRKGLGGNFGREFTKCARLIAMTDLTSPTGNLKCSFTGASMASLEPSPGCGCPDVASMFVDATHPDTNRRVCALAGVGQAALEGIYRIKCPYARLESIDPSLLGDSACVPLRNGKEFCVPRKQIEKSYASRDPQYSLTARYLNLSFDDIDAWLASDASGCRSSPYGSWLPPRWTAWWENHYRSTRNTPSDRAVQAPEPPLPSTDPKEQNPPRYPYPGGSVGGSSGPYTDNTDIDEFAPYRLRGRDAELYRRASDEVVWPAVLDTKNEALAPPETDPYWGQERKRSLEYLRGIQNARQRARAADTEAATIMSRLQTLNRLKREELMAIKSVAQRSAAYEAAVYSGLKQEIATDLIFAGVSIALKLNPVTGTILNIVTAKLVRKTTEKLVHDSNDAAFEDIQNPAQFATNVAVGVGYSTAQTYAVEWTIKKATYQAVEKSFGFIDKPSFKNPATNTLARDVRESIKKMQSKMTLTRINAATGAFAITKAFVDTQNYLSRDIADANPFEIAMAQQEKGIQELNKAISSLNTDLGVMLAIRDAAIDELRAKFCKDAYGNPTGEAGCS